MGKLTKAQLRFLSKVGDRLLPFTEADYRTHGPLLRRGFIAMTYSNGMPDGGGGYCLTPFGRQALAALTDTGSGAKP